MRVRMHYPRLCDIQLVIQVGEKEESWTHEAMGEAQLPTDQEQESSDMVNWHIFLITQYIELCRELSDDMKA